MNHDQTTAMLATPTRTNRAAPDVSLKEVSIVVPVFNERDCVASLMETLGNLDAQFGDRFQFDFVLVDDGSHDGSPELLREAIGDRENYRVVEHGSNRGIAAAMHTGIVHARHEIVASIDADSSYDVTLLEEMVPLLAGKVDLVTASPYHPHGAVEDVEWWRLWLSKRASWLYRQVMRSKLYCYTGCFRVYRRSRVIDLEPRNEGYVGVAELLWRLDQQGSVIVEYPAVLRKRVAGCSKMKIVSEAFRHLRLMSHIARSRLVRPLRK
jgi:dolichol-phosphate mannosyltransferase